jgi:hypothetical protein
MKPPRSPLRDAAIAGHYVVFKHYRILPDNGKMKNKAIG